MSVAGEPPPWRAAEARALADTAASARVLVIGSLNVDLILRADAEPVDDGAVLVRDLETAPGGHAGNCASALAALGMSVTLVAAVGADPDGDWLLDDLRRRGVDVSGVRVCPQAPTGRAVIPVFGTRHYMLLHRGANDLLQAGDALRASASEPGGFDAVLIFDPSEDVLLASGDLAGGGAKPPVLGWTPGGIYARDPVAARVIPQCDVLFANRAELAALSQAVPCVIADTLRPELIMTAGEHGAVVRHRGAQWQAPAQPVSVADPTGAGDAFSAAYLLARLAGLEPDRRLRAANLSGALAVSAVGARGRLATLADLLGP
jgi:ribokinase